MAYVKTNNGIVAKYPYSIGDLRKDNPQTSFPKQITEDTLSEYGVFSVSTQNPETVNERTQKIVFADTPTLVSGGWVLVNSVTNKTEQEIADYDASVAESVRSERNQKLSDTDWTVLQDSPFTDAQTADWVIYRQALRDITGHADFPYLQDADWPVKP